MLVWIRIAHADDYIYYGEPSSIETSGYKVKMLTLEDSASSNKSEVTLEEFDCKNKSTRILASAKFSENMGRGEMTSVDKSGLNLGVQKSNSIGGVKHKFGCKRANFDF